MKNIFKKQNEKEENSGGKKLKKWQLGLIIGGGIFFLLLLIIIISSSNCGSSSSKTSVKSIKSVNKTTEASKATIATEATTEETTAAPETTKAPETTAAPKSNPSSELFGKVSGKEYMCTSGAGGWMSYITISTDGSFRYSYNQTIASGITACDASGTFTNIKKVSDYEYVGTVGSIKADESPHKTTKDGVPYEYIEPGIKQGESVIFYIKGAPTNSVSGEFKSNVRIPTGYGFNDSTIPCYGIQFSSGESFFTNFY